jgi:F-type H+-transporting ATPase subunit b
MWQRLGLAIALVLVPLLVSGCDAAEELGVNWHGLVAQFISFGLLLIILVLVGYRPIMRMLDERSRRIKDSMDQAEFIKEQTAKTEQLVQEQITEARKQGQDIIAQAEQIGERLKEEAREQARKDAEAIVARAQAEIRAESQQAMDQLRQEFVDVAIKAAEKVIEKALDKEAHKEIIEKTLEESSNLGRGS